jgi:DNA-binding beta-propeller fold protein YncE
MRLAFALALGVVLVGAATAAAPPKISIPYDIELDSAGRLFIADGGKHQIFRWDARRKKLIVVAGTGKRGTSGDGGPAVRARLDEIAGLAFDPSGNLYVADVHYGAVRRIDRRGIITTVARAEGAAGVSIDPSGRYLAVAGIGEGVVRYDLSSGDRESLIAVGEHGLTGPHSLAYDTAGRLWVGDPGSSVLRLDPDGTVTPIPTAHGSKVVPLAGGAILVLNGDPSGGRIHRVSAEGAVTTIAGTGRIGRHIDGIAATRAAFLPTDAEPQGASILVGVVRPVPSIRRIDRAGKITTLVR